MRIRLSLTLDILRGQQSATPERETTLDALTERSDPHPEPDRPIGFRRTEDQ